MIATFPKPARLDYPFSPADGIDYSRALLPKIGEKNISKVRRDVRDWADLADRRRLSGRLRIRARRRRE
jgi:hypothetical protein